MQAEVTQPISGIPLRWGGFTARQLGWLGTGAALPYLLLRLQVAPELALASSAPWLGTALIFAFGRREGRRLDSWVEDWLWFKLQPHHLRHPGRLAADVYVAVDSELQPTEPELLRSSGALPWTGPWS